MTSDDAVILANPTTCELGEGPVWDPIRERVLWLDILRGTAFSGHLTTDGYIDLLDRVEFGQTVGAIGVAADGSWIVAGAHSLILHDAQGVSTDGAQIVPLKHRRRTNDGKPDPAGRFVVGTLALEGESDSETLVRLEDDGRITVIDDDLTLSNGLAWTGDGRTMYSIDTLRRLVYARSYDPVNGAVGARRIVVEIEQGYPDGMCLDADEHLWIAMWGLGEVHRRTPDGTLDHVLHVPAPHVSSIAFAGPELDTLVITTATQDLTADQLDAFPLSGGLFTARPGVRGLPATLWNGTFSDMEMRTA